MKSQDEYFMRYAIELAKKGGGYVHPNPLVACVIVLQNEIIGSGYHEYFGGDHAEVNAIKNLENKGFQDWNKVTLYVTLEPCSHFGKTPPCAHLIVEKGIKNVVIACKDIHSLVSGKGIKKLKESGVQVKTGVLEDEAKELNKRFFTFHSQKRPYIILKWAETKDGFISRLHFNSRKENIISSADALKTVHQWRSEEHSILAGFNTIVKDNPFFNVRFVNGKNPIKIILDKNLNLNPHAYNVFKGNEKIVVLNTLKEDVFETILYKKIHWENLVEEVMSQLYSLEIVSVFIEGGLQTLQKFIDKNLFDEIRIIKSKNKNFYEGIPAPKIYNKLQTIQKIDLKDDEIIILKNNFIR